MAALEVKPRWKGLNGPIIKRSLGYFTATYEDEAIKASVILAILTPLGSRPHRRSYGSRLKELVFEQNDNVLNDLALEYINEALRFEPRVSLQSLSAERTDTQLKFKVVLLKTSSNQQFQMEFGFNG